MRRVGSVWANGMADCVDDGFSVPVQSSTLRRRLSPAAAGPDRKLELRRARGQLITLH